MFVEIDEFESPKKSGSRRTVFENIFYPKLASNDNFLRPDIHRTSFSFCSKGIMVCPSFKVMAQDMMRIVKIIDNNIVFVLVTVPPFVAVFDVGTGICLPGIARLPTPESP